MAELSIKPMASSMPSMSINALNTVRIRSTIMPVPHCPRGRAIPRDREDARRRARGVLRRENRQIRAESSLRAPTGDAEGRRRCRLSRVSIRFGPRSLVRVDSGLLGIDPASPAHRQRGGKGPRARGQPTARTRWRLRARRSSRGMWSADWDVRPQSPRPPRTHPATRRHPHRDSPTPRPRLADTQTATRPVAATWVSGCAAYRRPLLPPLESMPPGPCPARHRRSSHVEPQVAGSAPDFRLP